MLKTFAIPRAGHELARLIREAVDGSVGPTNINALKIDCSSDGFDIPRMSVVATKWVIPGPELRHEKTQAMEEAGPRERAGGVSGELPSKEVSQDERQDAHLAYGQVGYIALDANPMRVDTTEIRVRAEFTEVPIKWSKTSSGELALSVAEVPANEASQEVPAAQAGANHSGVRGRFAIEFDAQEVAELYVQQINFEMPQSVEVYRPRVKIEQPRLDTFEFTGSCRWRYKGLRVRLGMTATGHISRDGILTVDDLSLKGSNIILRMLTSKIRKELENPIDLGDGLLPGARLANVQFTANDTLSLQAQVA